MELINLYIWSSGHKFESFLQLSCIFWGEVGEGLWTKAFIMVPKCLKISFFFLFFLEGSSLVERGGAGENVKAWSGKKAERHDLREWKLSGSAPVPAGRVQKVSILRKTSSEAKNSQTLRQGLIVMGMGDFTAQLSYENLLVYQDSDWSGCIHRVLKLCSLTSSSE